MPKSLEEAVAQLKRNPSHPAHARVDDLEIELRVISESAAAEKLGDLLAEGGGWKGETAEEILRLLREARAAGGTAEPPRL